MNYSDDASDKSPRNLRDRGLRRSDYQDGRPYPPDDATPWGASTRRPPIGPWLFVFATALNTMVAAVVAVFITLGVLRTDRPNSQPAETAPPPANIKPPIAPIAAVQPIGLLPIGSPNQPLRLEVQKPARLPLQILPEEAARESFILALSGAPAGTALLGATRIGSDSWFLAHRTACGSNHGLDLRTPACSSKGGGLQD
jgi:hypothetical protein